MKKQQLKSDGSMDSLSDRTKKKKKISYMYPEKLYKEAPRESVAEPERHSANHRMTE